MIDVKKFIKDHTSKTMNLVDYMKKHPDHILTGEEKFAVLVAAGVQLKSETIREESSYKIKFTTVREHDVIWDGKGFKVLTSESPRPSSLH